MPGKKAKFGGLTVSDAQCCRAPKIDQFLGVMRAEN
jgi:hypothetical protein